MSGAQISVTIVAGILLFQAGRMIAHDLTRPLNRWWLS